MALEEEFDVKVEEEELKDIATVGQAYELIQSKLPEQGSGIPVA
jgi:acyl carrier protein